MATTLWHNGTRRGRGIDGSGVGICIRRSNHNLFGISGHGDGAGESWLGVDIVLPFYFPTTADHKPKIIQ